ncbi:ABC transporter permease subunit [Dasania sp. GY-MA-18]|uniref:ABC transporter permease subunit n=1 Tax=Dasania phycosphaerae TaxID=2950436 RepID=A0A9J6RLS3_9GAMM|nr:MULTISPECIES: ABC transporter permease subunit [Dasania]MCR8922899.1 ABC transporter permease subunit [Dasania sp. GY-MA-18]MCZ0865330.1 ABC transporter permease subunit [Dasania phycosphaerae]MCZ0869055.1 ABC transporter permease subunit [Dasania phycosphaerae]
MKNTAPTSPVVPAARSLHLERLSGWRKAKDSLANLVISAGGMGVLMAILLIFFYLFYEIMPLFKSAHIQPQSSYELSAVDSSDSLFLAMEEQAEVALMLNRAGQAQFFNAATGASVHQAQLPLTAAVTSWALNSEQQPLQALGMANGQVLLAQPKYRISYPDDQRVITPSIEYPFGEQPLVIADAPLTKVAVRDTEEQLLIVAVAKGKLTGRLFNKEEDFLSEELTLEEQPFTIPEVDIVPQWLLLGPDQRWLYVVSQDGAYRVINIRDEAVAASGRLLERGQLTQVRFLLGGISLLAADNRGEISQWFMVREDGKLPRLEKIRAFKASDSAIEQLVVEHRRKGFITINQQQQLDVFYTTSGRQLLSEPVIGAAISDIAVAPRANRVLSRDTNGQFSYWQLENEHPEVSWSVLWQKVWYESYQEPDYIWQSSASNNDFEPKYSFTPLAFGTLKAAFYAMLLATPLAIGGAIYTAYFMTPAVRRKVKPLIELMEALPTVILGFLAGLWLAPFFERNLPGVFAIFMLFPLGILLFGYLWSQLPSRIRLAVPDGWHAILLIPVVIAITWACIASSGLLELWFFHGDMRAWLTHDLGISFDQRNAMVVGVAMGFAVVPTIFSITEDAVFSVPKSLSYGSLALGATPWQTLVGVVIPTASPGIFSALMIGMGRAVGETMIVLMATGNTPIMDANIFEGMRTLAANIAVEIGETEVDSSHFRVLFLAAFVLFMFTFVVNTIAEIVRQRLRKKYGSL